MAPISVYYPESISTTPEIVISAKRLGVGVVTNPESICTTPQTVISVKQPASISTTPQTVGSAKRPGVEAKTPWNDLYPYLYSRIHRPSEHLHRSPDARLRETSRGCEEQKPRPSQPVDEGWGGGPLKSPAWMAVQQYFVGNSSSPATLPLDHSTGVSASLAQCQELYWPATVKPRFTTVVCSCC
ncbi:hypothetical protein Bbelb_203670 [Branchiostoma belcheri]|nr:hypothetical protein Bbelb_203670 [Branchiostoma belcheri]